MMASDDKENWVTQSAVEAWLRNLEQQCPGHLDRLFKKLLHYVRIVVPLFADDRYQILTNYETKYDLLFLFSGLLGSMEIGDKDAVTQMKAIRVFCDKLKLKIRKGHHSFFAEPANIKEAFEETTPMSLDIFSEFLEHYQVKPVKPELRVVSGEGGRVLGPEDIVDFEDHFGAVHPMKVSEFMRPMAFDSNSNRFIVEYVREVMRRPLPNGPFEGDSMEVTLSKLQGLAQNLDVCARASATIEGKMQVDRESAEHGIMISDRKHAYGILRPEMVF